MARYFRGRGIYQGNVEIYFDTMNVAPEDMGKTFLAGDEYFNYRTGEVFLCTKAMQVPNRRGWHSGAGCWKYLRTDVIMSPWTTVSGLSIGRNGNVITVKWNVPSWVTDKKRNDRPDRIKVSLYAYKPDGKGSLFGRMKHWDNLSLGTKSVSYTLPREQMYPYWWTSMNRAYDTIGSVAAEVWLANAYGTRDRETARYTFLAPRKPTIGAISQDANTGVLSARIDTNKGDDQRERRDTFYAWTIYNSASGTKQRGEASQTSTSFVTNRDVPDRQQISYGDYVKATLGAYARGVMGNSEVAVRTYVISFPNKPTINVPKITREPNAGRVVFGVRTNVDKSGNFPVTGVRLQKLVSVDYDSAADIPANADWQNAGPQDNGVCTAMSIDLADLLPEAGKKTWVRLKTWNDIEAIFYRYSDPKRLTDIETPAPVEPSAGDDYAAILSCAAGNDGTSARLLIGWDRYGTDDSNWTEVSWDVNERAWRSTEPPKTFAFADQSWDEGQVTKDGVTYRKSAHLDIPNLEPGKKYYIAARRMMKPENGDSTFGPYSTKVTITPSDVTEAPESVTLSAGDVIRGEPVPTSWTYNGSATQQSWAVRKLVGNAKSNSDVVLAQGRDERRSMNLSYYRDSAATTAIAGIAETSIRLYVECLIAGTYVSSDPVMVRIVDRPSFEVAVQETLITQPAVISAFTNDPDASVSVIVESHGVSSYDPSGDTSQAAGDTIWSGTIRPSWVLVSSIADESAVQQAKAALDSAQEAYDDVMGQYDDARGRYDAATSAIGNLEEKTADETRDLEDAAAELDGYQERLDGMDPDDPDYEAAVTDVESATAKVEELEDLLADDTQSLASARAAQAEAESDMGEIDYSDERDALEAAIDAYSAAVADAIGPTASDMTHRASIELPEGLDLRDGGTYKVRAFATSAATGISSHESESTFVVSWAHQAPIPAPDISVTGFDETDGNEVRKLGARIELTQPTRALASDVYDVYRVSKDGAHLAASNVPTDATVTDEYAPFGGTRSSYIVACRTVDGDVDWLEYSYFLPPSTEPFYSMVRIDWDGKYLELDRNIGPSDSYEKDYVSHKHLDGTTSGHWNKGVARTLRISAAIVRGYDSEKERLIRELARFDGPCLVRTSDGVFVEGNVSVEGVSFGSRSAKGDVSIVVSEITPTGTFAPTVEEGE